jgi:hypothetical protein
MSDLNCRVRLERDAENERFIADLHRPMAQPLKWATWDAGLLRTVSLVAASVIAAVVAVLLMVA